jgi:CarD family transcriptional regulator, regulator of rRNA transcription
VADGTGSTKQHRVVSGSVPAGSDPFGANVGDTVVYAAHGIGRVVALEQRCVAGIERDSVVVDLAAGLRVTLSLGEAAERLRRVADGAELARIGATLAVRGVERDGSWTRRIKTNKAKLARGRPVDLAEIVRDGASLERSTSGGRLPHSERRVYLQARALLVSEICSARGADPDEADGWIDAQIAPPQGSED